MRYRRGLGVLFPKVFSKVMGYLAKEDTLEGPATYIPIYHQEWSCWLLRFTPKYALKFQMLILTNTVQVLNGYRHFPNTGHEFEGFEMSTLPNSLLYRWFGCSQQVIYNTSSWTASSSLLGPVYQGEV